MTNIPVPTGGEIYRLDLSKEITEAIARAWCHKVNEEKIMDPGLAFAASEEVCHVVERYLGKMVAEMENQCDILLAEIMKKGLDAEAKDKFEVGLYGGMCAALDIARDPKS